MRRRRPQATRPEIPLGLRRHILDAANEADTLGHRREGFRRLINLLFEDLAKQLDRVVDSVGRAHKMASDDAEE